MMDGCMAVVTTKFSTILFCWNTITWWGISLEFLGCILFSSGFSCSMVSKTWKPGMRFFLLFLLCTRKNHTFQQRTLDQDLYRPQATNFGLLIYISKHAHFFRGKVTNPPQVFLWALFIQKPQKLMMSTPFKAAVASFPGQAVVAAAGPPPVVARAAQGAGRRQAARVVRMWLGTLSKSCQRLGRKPQGCLRMWRKLPKRLSLKGPIWSFLDGSCFFFRSKYIWKWSWNQDWHDRMPQVGMALLVSYRFLWQAFWQKNACRPRSLGL